MRSATGKIALLLLPLFLVGCDRGLKSDELARAGDFTLTIEEAAGLLADVPDLPNDVGVVDAVAQFWTDYTLLAWAVNQEGGLADLDISALVDRRVAESQILQLREMVIQVDTSFTEEEIRARYEEDRPGEELRARHILFAYPTGATPVQRDSVRTVAQGILEQVQAGGNFATLAEQHSSDAVSAAQGGDLDYFGRGAMIASFEEAAYALETGEVSDLVETEYGLHIIRVDDRRIPPYEEVAESFRSQLVFQTVSDAEVAYVQGVESAASPEIAEGAIELVRDIADNISTPLSRRDAERPIVTYNGGEYTAAELVGYLANTGPDLHQQIVTAPAEQLEPFLLELARAELLVADAQSKGISVPADSVALFEEEFRTEYTNYAQSIGLDAINPEAGESLSDAIDREIMALMARLISGEAQVIPLGPLAFPLRATFGSEISDAAMDLTVARVTELRGAAAPEAAPMPAPAAPELEPAPAPAPEEAPATEAAPAPDAP